jgi:tRNA (cytidine/uridine-2'-O-)-methyltransferase
MRLALYQPDIPQNTGTMLRMAACLGVAVDIIGPAGFDASDKAMRRAGLDYLEHVEVVRHLSFAAFEGWRLAQHRRADGAEPRPDGAGVPRLVLLTTRAATLHTAFAFRPDDILLVGRESAGVPEAVHEVADARVRVPMRSGLRSLNVAVAAAIVIGEALRQADGWPA